MAAQEFRILQCNEEWEQVDPFCVIHEDDNMNDHDLKFNCTHIYFRQGDSIFWSTAEKRDFELDSVDLSTIERTVIPIEEIYPEYDQRFTLAPSPLPEGVYVKHPRMVHYSPESQGALADRFLNEVSTYEALKDKPHPNIAPYYGCVVEDGRITGIALKHYSSDLIERLEKGGITKEQGSAYAAGVEDAARHLHFHGYAHRDIRKSNVMLDGETPILIDLENAASQECMGCRGVRLGADPDAGEVVHDHSLSDTLKDRRDLVNIRVAIIVAQISEG